MIKRIKIDEDELETKKKEIIALMRIRGYRRAKTEGDNVLVFGNFDEKNPLRHITVYYIINTDAYQLEAYAKGGAIKLTTQWFTDIRDNTFEDLEKKMLEVLDKE